MTAKEVFDARYETYRNLERKPAIPLEARTMIFAAMEDWAIISNEQKSDISTSAESVVCSN